MESDKKRQSVVGFKVVRYTVKKAKDTEKVVLVLEADVDDIGAGEHNMGDVQGALLNHQVGDTDVALGLFMDK